ncbi:uS10/mL48 family ribosomal protein [Halalkalicoccus sp. NIPERK01]|uniref:uS10/mL48 family ribosomal protein n=1 Tax=Halalkalicoccus sp. NIPERK01 TaxID=3053469 RepID=UPI00256F239A|nr:uS10/mL48 family ribosomal protein [Halalkalicoccus sp. NIPERK01]MDL5361889.1 uS10/mL48 family ribosomal protein [Halalkalicoccus sp. NIPERK01]
MTFVTKLTLQSGDRAVLDRVVGEIADFVERKGAEMKGPHPSPPETLRVPQHKRTTGGETFGSWSYTVYTRTIEIVGHDEVARRVTDRDLPAGVHLGVEVEQIRPLGST